MVGQTMPRRGPRAFHSRSDCGRQQKTNNLTLRCAPPLLIRGAVGLPVHTDAVSTVEGVHSELGELDAGAAIVGQRSLVVDGKLKDASKRT
jgi:hypothetical protein